MGAVCILDDVDIDTSRLEHDSLIINKRKIVQRYPQFADLFGQQFPFLINKHRIKYNKLLSIMANVFKARDINTIYATSVDMVAFFYPLLKHNKIPVIVNLVIRSKRLTSIPDDIITAYVKNGNSDWHGVSKNKILPDIGLNNLLRIYSAKKISAASLKLLTQCNARCVMCDIASKIGGNYILKTEDASKILESLAKAGIEFVNMTGGEVTLRNDLPYLVEKAHCLKIQVCISTNAHNLDDSSLTTLKSAGLSHINFSLDGHCAELHDAIRQLKGNFDKNISMIKKALDLGLSVNVNSVILKENYLYLDKMLMLLARMGVKNLNFFMVEKENESDKHKLNIEQIKDFYSKILPALFDLSDKMGVRLQVKPDYPGALNDIDKFCNYQYGKAYFDKTICTEVFRSVQIRENGDVYPCCWLSGRKEYLMGNLLEDDFKTIINSQKYIAFRKSYKMPLTPHCATCKQIH